MTNYWTGTEEKHKGGTIENWRILSSGRAVGTVFKDSRGNLGENRNFSDGSTIITSRIVKLDLKNKTLETLNTVYTLGTRNEHDY